MIGEIIYTDRERGKKMKYSEKLKLVQVIKKIEEAAAILEVLQNKAEDSKEAGSLESFKEQLLKTLECFMEEPD
jgi:hypothetical protein